VQPIRIALGVFVLVVLAGYSWAMLRGLPANEVSPADTSLVKLFGWVGILLVAHDGIDNLERFRVLLRRIALTGGLLALLGLLQFFTKQTLIDWISIPGMSSDGASLDAVNARAGFVRASGTAIHPLEYGLVLCAAFPIAITLAIEERTRGLISRWFPVATIAMASVLSISRSALLGIAAGLIVLIPGWSPRVRRTFLFAGTGLVILIGLLVPGMIGTIRGMFTGISTDSSALSRVNSYDTVTEFIARFPIVGKGFGTFQPAYHILDNQFLQLAIEIGVFGLVVFVAILGSAIWSGNRARQLAPTQHDRALAIALMASVVSGGLLLAFFDAFSFPMAGGMLFLTIGLCGGWRRAMMHEASSSGAGLTQPRATL
jgi:O-antigen ligase